MSLFTDDEHAVPQPQQSPSIRPSRRFIVGWVAVLAAFALTLVLALAPAPYVIEIPGPVFNTLGTDQEVGAEKSADAKELITIPGQKTYETSGSLDLLTVSVVGNPDSRPSWFEIVTSWFQPSRAVLPIDSVFPPGTTTEQSNAENAALMVDSQQDAVAAALNELGYDFPQAVVVKQLITGTPAAKTLREGDEITSVDGTAVKSVQALRDAIAANGTDKEAQIGVLRDGASSTVGITPVDSGGRAVLGIGAGMDYTFPFDVKIQLDNVGGPSAGQMFALGIIDKLTPGELTGGKRIAGTGTIDNAGNIGAIGGIRQKMFAARDQGKAQYFLAPASNCNEVTGHIPSGLTVFAVKTLSDSLAVLKAVSTGAATAGLPTCPSS
ncbi:YlbL family protein [Leifsonia aquatica]|uniref:YlbL family protein n=1 Tax=Leifsonia aquatica TaxID=144185 RepID=UPI0004695E89|nr:PDZ domain-containing protein [Leifsonia aquatica]